jgi:EAL domain-containing protein (putative c-di-GMP-specific phosphodiesterase class I)
VSLFRIDGGAEICLELSEEQFIGDPRELTDRIAALRSAGVKLAIDDVGKGRGTLDSVVVLEPDSVKIDKELISGACRDIRKERLLRRLVSVAHAMRCEVVGEGVETAEDLALMRELEVPYAQGYYWSKPCSYRDLAGHDVIQKTTT